MGKHVKRSPCRRVEHVPSADHVEHRHRIRDHAGIAVPMIGGMISSTLLTLIMISAIFGLIKGFRLPSEPSADALADKGSRDQAAGPVLDCPEAAE
jgi:hypothetical protein